MGLPFHFASGEGPVIEKPVRDGKDVALLRSDRAADLGYVAEAVRLGATVLWEERYWEEFGGNYAAFRDPWGMEVCLWRDKGTYTTATQ